MYTQDVVCGGQAWPIRGAPRYVAASLTVSSYAPRQFVITGKPWLLTFTGNEYKITNIHTTPLLIFFSQSRKVRATSEEIAAHDAQIAASQAGAQAQSQSQRRESNAAASKKKSLPNGKATGKGKGKRAPDPDEQETEQEDDAEEGEEEEEEVVVPKKKVKSR